MATFPIGGGDVLAATGQSGCYVLTAVVDTAKLPDGLDGQLRVFSIPAGDYVALGRLTVIEAGDGAVLSLGLTDIDEGPFIANVDAAVVGSKDGSRMAGNDPDPASDVILASDSQETRALIEVRVLVLSLGQRLAPLVSGGGGGGGVLP